MLKVFDVNDNALEVEVIRYFKFNNNNYFMYTLNEIDEQNYARLYALKVTENLQGETITSDDEWSAVKDEIKNIIRGNKDGNLVVEDLNYNELKNFKMAETRAFKLPVQMTELLKANKKEFAEIEPTNFNLNVEPTLPEVEEMDETDPFSLENTMPIPSLTEELAKETVEEPVLPEIELPTMEEPVLPEVELPTMEEPVMPEVELPTMEESVMPEVELPTMEEPVMPEVELPTMEEPVMPEVELPTMEEPVLPEIELPTVEEKPVVEEPTYTPDYSFENEDLASVTVDQFAEETEEDTTTEKVDYKELYEEEKALTEVLKNEISQLREKLNSITKIVSE